MVVVLVLLLGAGGAALVLADGRGGDAAGARMDARCAPRSCSRTEVAAARIGRFVYVVGGFEQRSGATTAAVERYDIARDRWRRVRPMPVALNHPAATAHRGARVRGRRLHGPRRPARRGVVAAALRPAPRPLVAAAERAHEAGRAGRRRDRREALRGGRRQRRATARCARSRSTTSRAGAGRAVRTWAARASTSPGRSPAAPSTCWRAASPARATSRPPSATCRGPRRWERLPDMRKPRGGIAAATVAGRVVVVGGEEAGGTIGEVEVYDPATARLEPPAPTCALRATGSASWPAGTACTRSRAARRRASTSRTRSRRSTCAIGR